MQNKNPVKQGHEINILFYRVLFTGSILKYDYGLYRLGINNMIITRGVSSSGEALPRMNNPAEIVQITLR